jgi:ATP-dependent protease ClpP protease subunit
MNHNIKIYGEIVPFKRGNGYFSIEDLNNSLVNLKLNAEDNVIVGINTVGGNVEAGFSIYNILRRFAKENNVTITTRLDGYCASIGTVILLAGDNRIGNEFAHPFVHNAQGQVKGDANDMLESAISAELATQKIADFYASKINITAETARDLMQGQTWIEPNSALEYGFFTKIENYSNSKEVYNMIITNNNYINLNNKNMNTKEKIFNAINKVFGVSNKIIFDAENNEIDFYELAEGDTPKIGDKANYKGQPAQGEILTQNGESFVFENATLSQIKEVVADDNALAELKAENENLKAELESLKNSNKVSENKIIELSNYFNELKNLESNVSIIDLKPKPNEPITESAFMKSFNNLKNLK